MKLLQVVTDTDRRGAQVFATDLARALEQLGHSVRTVALTDGGSDGLDLETLGPSRRSPRTVRSLRSAAAVDVVIAHGSTTLPVSAIALAGSGVPFVYRQISDSRFWVPDRMRRSLVRLAMGRAAKVVALSEFNRRDLVDYLGVPDDRIRVVANGVPADRFRPPMADQRVEARLDLDLGDGPVALYAGAMVPEKGVDVAIEAVGALGDVTLLVAGEGPERGHLEALAATRAPDRIRFLGSVPDLLRVYWASDLLVLPSKGGDAMPATIIEAGLCGLPAVSTRVGAIPEIVEDGRSGVLAGPGDVDGFGAAVSRLLDDPPALAAAGVAARERCLDRYEIGPVAEGWERVLREVAPAA